MALTMDDFSKIIAGDGNQVTDRDTEVAKAVFEAYDKDIQGLKFTNAQLKQEKTELKGKYDADLNKFAETSKTFEEQIEALKSELASSSGKDQAEIKKFYETQKETLEQSYRLQLQDKDKRISEYEAQIQNYERAKTVNEMEKEFMEAISKTKADPSTYGVIKTLVLGENGSRFAPHDSAEGRMFWSVDGSAKSIQASVDEFMKGEMGKRFIPFQSSGSGAEGGAGAGIGNGVNPWKTGNVTQQMIMMRDNPELAKQFKAAAGK